MALLQPLFRTLALLALVALASRAPAQDDVPKSAAEAQKQLGEIQKGFAGGTDSQKRLRIDKFEAVDGQVKVTGVFLDGPAAKEGDTLPFDAVQEEASKLLRDRLKDDKLKFEWAGVKKIEPKDHPHVVLQVAANAAGEKDAAADRFLFAGSRFGANGGVILSGTRGKDADTAKWLASAITAHLAKHPAVKVVADKPLVTDETKPVDWKLSPADVQKLFATSPDASTRRLRVDRVYLAYDAENPDLVARWSTFRATLTGVRLGTDPVDKEALTEACRKQWPELFAGVPKVLVYPDPLLGPGLPEPTAKFQTTVAAKPALDGVRIDPGAEFAADGSLMFAGLQPGLTAAAEKELIATYQAVVKEFVDKADADSPRYKKLAEGGVSVKQMKVVPTGKLLSEIREWAANTMDDARLSRIYFAADGGLKLQVKTVTKADSDKVQLKFKELAAKYLPADAPKLPKGDSALPDADAPVFVRAAIQPAKTPEPATDPTTFSAGFTAHLRKEMAGDQKRWNGVLIERGYFDAENRFTLRGVVDTAVQNDALVKLFDELKADVKWADYFTPTPNKPVLEVVPLSDLLDRVKRVVPAYPEFDGIRIESARYDANVNLIFDAHVAGRLENEPAMLLAKLLRDHPTYKRRAPADKQVRIVRVTGPPDTDPQAARFSMAYGAKLLSGTDAKKTKTWLDSALLHYPSEAGVWFLSAYYNHAKGDAELVRRDLYRMIELEGAIAFNGTAQRKRRYDAAKDIQGKERNELEALWLEYFREVKDGAKPITMTKEK